MNDILDREGNKKIILWHSSFIKNNQNKIIASLNLGEDISGEQNIKKKIVEERKVFQTFSRQSLRSDLYDQDQTFYTI
jgi:hypothetical protein